MEANAVTRQSMMWRVLYLPDLLQQLQHGILFHLRCTSLFHHWGCRHRSYSVQSQDYNYSAFHHYGDALASWWGQRLHLKLSKCFFFPLCLHRDVVWKTRFSLRWASALFEASVGECKHLQERPVTCRRVWYCVPLFFPECHFQTKKIIEGWGVGGGESSEVSGSGEEPGLSI